MLRIASYNIENLDFSADDSNPQLEKRIPFLRATLNRLQADILCLQEVHGQELPDHESDDPNRDLAALDRVLQETVYAGYHRACTLTSDDVPYNVRNLVVLSRFPIVQKNQYRNDLVEQLLYRKMTAQPPESEAKAIRWERPIQHVSIDVPSLQSPLQVINLHLKSRLPSNVEGQKASSYSWRSASGWAEGYFISSMKRVGQALETRRLIDQLFDADAGANILVCGDFNAEPGQVPVEAICGTVENTGNDELAERALTACSQGIARSVRYTHLHHGQGNLLDHMLMSQSMVAHFRSARILNEDLHDESLPFHSDSKFPQSDHAAFLSEFTLDV